MWGLIGKLAMGLLKSKNQGIGRIAGIASNINSARQTKGVI